MASKPLQPWRMPPIAKVYEALGAIGDGRVHLEDQGRATVTSSDRSKTYVVETAADSREVSSNDNASYWQGYLGYPAIAVMIAGGLYQPRADVAKALSGIPWKELNRRFHNDYERTVAEVLREASAHGFDPSTIRCEAQAVLDAVRTYAPLRGQRRRPPRS